MILSEAFLTNAITILFLIILTATFLLPKKIRYAAHSVFLLFLGGIPLLYKLGVLGFTWGEAGIIKYAVAVIVVLTARSLIMEGIKEEGKIRMISISLGIIIIILTTVPALHNLEALTFTIPQYPAIIDNIIYVIASVFTFIGVFISDD